MSASPEQITEARGVSILDLIGNTPLLSLPRLGRTRTNVEIYAKAEWQNPGGSTKDRAAASKIGRAHV